MCTVTVKLINMLLCRGTVTSHVVWAGLSPALYKVGPFYFWADFGPFSFWAGSGPFKKFSSKMYLKNLWFSARLYFCTIKIQVRYENTRFSSRHQKKYKMKKCFVFLHTANTLTLFLRFLVYKKQIFEALKMCFRIDFLNTTKIIFLAFLDFTTCL